MTENGAIITKNGYDFAFNPSACKECAGECCTGESGYIWISEDEMAALADNLEISLQELSRIYLEQVGNRHSIREKKSKNGYACIFFDENRVSCQIYEIRPTQCRTYPFWQHFKNNKEEVQKECIGILPLL